MTPYTETANRASPRPISWLAAQKRPLIAAHVAALALLAVAVWADGLPLSALPRLVWPGLLYYVAFLLAFLLPILLVQAVVYSQMWQRGQPYFVAVTDAAHLDPARCCRFLLSLRAHVFLLAVLAVDTRERDVHWTRPAWLYLALFATALFGFCLWTTFGLALPPLLLLAAITFWSTSLVFGLGHLLHGA